MIPGGRFAGFAQAYKVISRGKKLEITTQDVGGKPISIVTRISDLSEGPDEKYPTKIATYIKADYRINIQSNLSAIRQLISFFIVEKRKQPTHDFFFALMNNGSIQRLTKEQFESYEFDFSDLNQRFL